MNKLDETIERLEGEEQRSERKELLLQLLYEARENLGEDVSQETAAAAVREATREVVRQMGPNLPPGSGGLWDRETKAFLALIRSAFETLELDSREYSPREDVVVFEAEVRSEDKKFLMRTWVDGDSRICHMAAVYPFRAKDRYFYPLCAKLVEENYERAFGHLHYSAEDGELSCRYSFPVTSGFREEDFRELFLGVAVSAAESYGVLRQYAYGRFSAGERNHIICNAQRLIIALAPRESGAADCR